MSMKIERAAFWLNLKIEFESCFDHQSFLFFMPLPGLVSVVFRVGHQSRKISSAALCAFFSWQIYAVQCECNDGCCVASSLVTGARRADIRVR
jgi:hypothetical protein